MILFCMGPTWYLLALAAVINELLPELNTNFGTGAPESQRHSWLPAAVENRSLGHNPSLRKDWHNTLLWYALSRPNKFKNVLCQQVLLKSDNKALFYKTVHAIWSANCMDKIVFHFGQFNPLQRHHICVISNHWQLNLLLFYLLLRLTTKTRIPLYWVRYHYRDMTLSQDF